MPFGVNRRRLITSTSVVDRHRAAVVGLIAIAQLLGGRLKDLAKDTTGEGRSAGSGNAELQDRPGIGELLNGRSRLGRHQTIGVSKDVDIPMVWAQHQRPVAVRGLEVLGDITLDGAAVLGEPQAVNYAILQTRHQ